MYTSPGSSFLSSFAFKPLQFLPYIQSVRRQTIISYKPSVLKDAQGRYILNHLTIPFISLNPTTQKSTTSPFITMCHCLCIGSEEAHNFPNDTGHTCRYPGCPLEVEQDCPASGNDTISPLEH